MADPFDAPLPTTGQKPWSLNPAIEEVRSRVGGVEDYVSGPAIQEAIADAAASIEVNDATVANLIAEPTSDTNITLVDQIADPASPIFSQLTSQYARVDLSGIAKKASQINLGVSPAINLHKYIPSGVDPSTTDVTAYIQQVFDEAAAAGVDSTVYVPGGTTRGEPVVKSNIKIIGPSQGRASIRAVPGSSRKGVITFDQTGGPITRFAMEGVAIVGEPTNTNQWGIYAKIPPRAVSPFDSGIWYSSLKDIRVTNTLGGGIWLNGGGDDSLGPMQFLNWSNVSIQVTSGSAPNWDGILLSGQVGQVDFSQVESSYRGTGFGHRALWIARQMDENKVNLSDRWGYSLTFNACTFQGAAVSVEINRAQGIVFDGCWFEDNQNGWLLKQGAQGIVFDGCAFADSADNGGTGYIGRVEDNSFAVVTAPRIMGVVDTLWSQDAATTCFIKVIADTSAASRTLVGFPKNFSSSGTVVLGSSNFVGITGAAEINTLSSTLEHGDTLTVRCLSALNMNPSTGNIRFPTGWGSSVRQFENNSRLFFIYDKAANNMTLLGHTGSNQVARNLEISGAAGTGYLQFGIQSATPPTPSAGFRQFARLNGSSKVEICAVYPDGAVQILHTQP